MNKTNLLSGILTVGSMVVAGVAIRKVKQHQSCEDYAWKCHNEVMYDLDITRKDLEQSYDQVDRLIGTCKDWVELYEEQKQDIENLHQACNTWERTCSGWEELCEKQEEQIKNLQEALMKELLKD